MRLLSVLTLALLISCSPELTSHTKTQDHFVSPPKAIDIAHAFNGDNGARVTFSPEDGGEIIIPGGTSTLGLRYDITNKSSDFRNVSCDLNFNEVMFERKITAPVHIYLSKSHTINVSPYSTTLQVWQTDNADPDLTFSSITCTMSSKITASSAPIYSRIDAQHLACLFDLKIKVPVGRSNPALECVFDKSMFSMYKKKKSLVTY